MYSRFSFAGGERPLFLIVGRAEDDKKKRGISIDGALPPPDIFDSFMELMPSFEMSPGSISVSYECCELFYVLLSYYMYY